MEPIIRRKVAELLLEAGAIQIRPSEPFTWASGWLSPIYCDNRLTLSVPKARTFLKNQFVRVVKDCFPEAEAIAGVATAGIPQAALLADELKLPLLYVRNKPKAHGMTNQIEGKVVAGQKVVVLEDLISTGGSALRAIHALQGEGMQVLGMTAVFSYGFPEAQAAFKQAGVATEILCDYPTLLEQAQTEDRIDAETLPTLQAWRENPAEWQG